MFQFLEPLQHLRHAFMAERSPRQIAWAVSLGCWLGMIPKGNLTAWLLGVVLLATRVNLGVGMLAAMLVTALAPLCDPLYHAIGLRLVHLEGFQALLVRGHDVPLVPWLRLNNTVVLGSFALGLILVHPVQHLTHQFVVWVTPKIKRPRPLPDTPPGEAEALEIPLAVQEALGQIVPGDAGAAGHPPREPSPSN